MRVGLWAGVGGGARERVLTSGFSVGLLGAVGEVGEGVVSRGWLLRHREG